MENLCQTAELDLSETLEGEFSMPVEITSPDGIMQKFNANNPSALLRGQVRYTCQRLNPETGEIMVVEQSYIGLRKSSLIRVPKPGEKWYIKYPISPVAGADMVSFLFSPTRAPENIDNLGIVKMYAQRIDQEFNIPDSSGSGDYDYDEI